MVDDEQLKALEDKVNRLEDIVYQMTLVIMEDKAEPESILSKRMKVIRNKLRPEQ
jgi:hypothetical protein